ncbi:universal stress protein [Ilumatobacter nonamiensis]|uniref:universal stress protein n=1 Tax=Ilumatobacter nonamiensis TaxID=467093 RepID=UPI0003482AAF|nr:universal stress protein [Ilumatobacter nonamiensis]
MASIVLLCTDGSDVSIEALRKSLPLLAPADRTILVTVESPVDAEKTTGTGFAGRRSSPELAEQIETSGDRQAKEILDSTADALGLDDPELMCVVGAPGEAICTLVTSLPASVVVIGNSGRSGLRRAVMGSTSDYIVRHSACPVLVQAVGHR